jgi:hypothetical protein
VRFTHQKHIAITNQYRLATISSCFTHFHFMVHGMHLLSAGSLLGAGQVNNEVDISG